MTDDSRREMIKKYFQGNQPWCVAMVTNGGPKNAGHMQKVDAEDLVQDVFVGYLENPESFNIKYVYNRLMQRRKNWFRNLHRKVNAEAKYKEQMTARQPLPEEYNPEVMTIKEEMRQNIRAEIAAVKNPVHREILEQHLIDSVALVDIDIATLANRKKVASRFKKSIVTKYKEV